MAGVASAAAEAGVAAVGYASAGNAATCGRGGCSDIRGGRRCLRQRRPLRSRPLQAHPKLPLPVEVVPFGWKHAARRVAATGCEVVQRMKNGAPFVTDNGNYVLDCRYPGIADPAALQRTLDALPGVVDHGLFVGMAGRVVVGDAQGKVRVLP